MDNSPEALRKIKRLIQTRTYSDETLYIWLKHKDIPDILFIIEWWNLYRVYIAKPVAEIDGKLSYVHITTDSEWCRFIKRYLRTEFGLHHVHNINNKSNEKKVASLIGVTEIVR